MRRQKFLRELLQRDLFPDRSTVGQPATVELFGFPVQQLPPAELEPKGS